MLNSRVREVKTSMSLDAMFEINVCVCVVTTASAAYLYMWRRYKELHKVQVNILVRAE